MNPILKRLQSEYNDASSAYTENLEQAENVRKQNENTSKGLSTTAQAEFDKYLTAAESAQADMERIKREIKLEQGKALIDNSLDFGDIESSQESGERKPKTELEQKQFLNQTITRMLKYEEGYFEQMTDEEKELFSASSLANPTNAGFLVTPEQFQRELLKDIDNSVYMRQISRVIPVTEAGALGVPTLDTDLNDADWTGENTQTTEDNALQIGKRQLEPNYYSKEVKISKSLMKKSAWPEELIRKRLLYKMSVTQENAYLNGNGVDRPLGIFVASANGIPTSRDTETGTANVFDFDDLVEMVHGQTAGLKEGHYNQSTWIVSRDFLVDCRLMKDDANQYIWQPFGMAGQQATGRNPGLLMGRPYLTSEYATTKTSGAWANNAYAAVLGNFDFYWIAEMEQLEMQVLNELYARTNHIGIIGRGAVDAMPVLAEAFSRLKIKSS